MTTILEVHKVNSEDVAKALGDLRGRLADYEGEVTLDFSGVRRVDPSGLRAIEDLAAAAEAKSVKVSLQGVNVGVYKVLKLARLTVRFSFVN
jgi:ABC-type transporter Mla MlaB component